jgi:hypothetical protein
MVKRLKNAAHMPSAAMNEGMLLEIGDDELLLFCDCGSIWLVFGVGCFSIFQKT